LKGGVDVPKLAAHIDVFPTFAEIAGVKIPAKLQLDGAGLVSLLENPQAGWPDRFLFTHVGRWAKGQAKQSQYANCAVRNSRFRMVSVAKGQENWELFDILKDQGESRDVRADHPKEFRELKAAYDRWWQAVQPD